LGYIRIPHSNQFDSEVLRLAVLFHEIGHWGDHTILERKPTLDKSTPEYAYEELVAEIAACFLCQSCGIPTEWDNHAGYVASWLQSMKNDTSYIFAASRDATKIADTILQRAGIQTEPDQLES
jgi:antirestriction protein ArdC